jgi:apoptosis-inducing factor 2
LVIAPGASPSTPLLGSLGAHEQSVEAITEFRGALAEAKSIVIAGGGPAGIEAAGELGEALNGKAGLFSARPKLIKTKITVITADQKILPILRPALATKAIKLLNKRGVDVVTGVRVVSTEPPNAGKLGNVVTKTTVTLSNGETLDADLYIPATGTRANTSWVPKDLLDERSLIDANGSTLRVDKAGPRVYAVGDVSNAGRGGVLEILDTVPIVVGNIKRDLQHAATEVPVTEEKEGATNGAAVTAPKGEDRKWVRKDQESQLVPIGHGGGVGAFFGWKLPGFMVWAIKGRDYMSSQYPKSLDGRAWAKEG